MSAELKLVDEGVLESSHRVPKSWGVLKASFCNHPEVDRIWGIYIYIYEEYIIRVLSKIIFYLLQDGCISRHAFLYSKEPAQASQ